MRFRACILFTLLAAIAIPALSQEHPNIARGFGVQASFDRSQLDSINKFNGNLNIRIPLGFDYPVNGQVSYGLNLFYSGNNWRYTTTTHDEYGDPLPQPSINAHASDDWNAGFGWLVSLGRIAIPPGFEDLAYQSPDGHWHRLYASLHESDWPRDAGDTTGRYWMYTRDGSYIRAKMVPGEHWELHFPDGAVHMFYSNGQIFRMKDRYGNKVDIDIINPNTTYEIHPNTEWPTANTLRLRDDHGRVHYIHMRHNDFPPYETAGPYQIVGKVEVAGPHGTRATYRMNYTRKVFSHPCTSNPTEPIYTWMPALTSVDLPDGTKFDMPDYDTGDNGYNCSDPNAGSFSGTLKSMKLPTLGKIEWVYREYQFPGNGEQDAYHSFHAGGVGTRRMRNADGTIAGIRTYSTAVARVPGSGAPPPPSHVVNTITTYEPNGTTILTREKAYFSCETYSPEGGTPQGWYGLPLSRVPRAAATNVAANPDGSSPGRFLSTETFDAAGTLLRSTYARYEGDDNLLYTGEWNQRLVSERTIFHDDTGCVGGMCTKYTDYSSFDGLGHFRYAVTSGNYRTAADTRTTYTAFNTGNGTHDSGSYPGLNNFHPVPVTSPWVLHLYPEQTVTEGSATTKTQFCWDVNTGFLLRKRILSGTAPGANDLLTVYTPDVKGNLLREERFGGDVQALGTTALCSLALPANQFRIDHTYQYGQLKTSQHYDAAGAPLSFKSVDRDIDLGSGFVITSRDSAGLATTYEYDTQGRPTWTKSAQAGWTQLSYGIATTSAPAYVYTRRWNNGQTVTLAEESLQLDGFGRKLTESVKLPDGTWTGKKTLHNGAGWVSAVSEIQPVTSVYTTYTFDAFGRVRTITPPDGAAHQVTIAYTGDRVRTTTKKVGTSRDGSGNVVESNAVKTETYDAYGKLWKVTEQSGAAGANVTTTYDYDITQNLKQATTVAAEGTQTRTFTRDGRGLLLSELLPEKGTATTFGNYDALGNVGRRSNAASGVWDILHTYDRAGRLVTVQSSRSGVVRALKDFTYGTANGTVDGVTDYRNGKQVLARRHNWIGGVDYQVTENFYYGGKQGSLSRRTTSASTGATFTQTFTSNDLGDRATTGYPSCTHGCPGEPARTVSFGYTNGHLTSVPSYATSITYHNNGMISTIAHANGVTWNQTIAANAMQRPASIFTTGALTGGVAANWNSGAYLYDGARNIVKMGNDYVLYDRAGRVIEATADQNGGATEKQSQTFDSFGNITSFTTNGTARSLPTSAATNRVNGAGFDANGNMTSYLSDTYEWDDLNAMISLTPGTKGWYYAYTASGERLIRYNSLGAYAYYALRDTDGKLLREYLHSNWRADGSLGAGTWSWSKDYVYGGAKLLAAVTATETRHFHLDHLGTPRLITGAGAVVRSRHGYFAFGEEATSIVQNSPAAEERMKFTGHERDLNGPAGTENLDYLDYMHARYYNPISGRFLTVDPADADPRMPQSWNRYLYALGNPINLIDPDGMLANNAVYRDDVDAWDIGFSMEITVTASGGGGGGMTGMYIPPSVMGLMYGGNSYGGSYGGGSGFGSVGGGGGGGGGCATCAPITFGAYAPNSNNVTISTPKRLDNPDTLTISLSAVSIVVDKNGGVYFQVGVSKSFLSTKILSASVMFGSFAVDNANPNEIQDWVRGQSYGIGGGSVIGGRVSGSPGDPMMYEYGVTTPSFEAGGSYTWRLIKCRGCK